MNTVWQKIQANWPVPIATFEDLLEGISGVPDAVTNAMSKTGWLYLVSALLIAVALYVWRRQRGEEQGSLLSFLFPKKVFLHPSALVDYRFVFIDLTFRAILYAPFIGLPALAVHRLVVACIGLTPLHGCLDGYEFVMLVAAPIVGILLEDFCFFFAHYVMHKSEVLWQFHAVHHSAEVLTPVTVYRVHPVEEFVNITIASCGAGLITGLYSAFHASSLNVPTIMGVAVTNWLFFTLAFNLRHSHIWLCYGPVLSRIFISPAQHQIHHSAERRHYDVNFGYIFAFWDVLFRCLYVPQGREEFRLGVKGADPADFDSVGKLYWLPFVKAYRCLINNPHGVPTYGSPDGSAPRQAEVEAKVALLPGEGPDGQKQVVAVSLPQADSSLEESSVGDR